jgi:hypothetical protein
MTVTVHWDITSPLADLAITLELFKTQEINVSQPVSSLISLFRAANKKRINPVFGTQNQIVRALDVLSILHPDDMWRWLARNGALELEWLADADHDCLQIFCYLWSSC